VQSFTNADTRLKLRYTGKINAFYKIMLENQKKRKYGNKRNFYINIHLEDRLDREFTACYGELMAQRRRSCHLPHLTHIAT